MPSDTYAALNCDDCGRFTTEKSGGHISIDYETGSVDVVCCVNHKPDYEAMAIGLEELGRELEGKGDG